MVTITRNNKNTRSKKNHPAQANVKRPPPSRQFNRARAKQDAIIIKTRTEEDDDTTKSYAAIAVSFKEKVDLSASDITVERTKMTRSGVLLAEVGRNQTIPQDVCGAIVNADGELGELKRLQEKTTLVHRGIDVTANEGTIIDGGGGKTILQFQLILIL